MRATRLIRMGSAVMGAAMLYVTSPAPVRADTKWFDTFVNELRAASEMSGNMEGVQFVVGNDIWQPGREFKSGANWLALACGPAACAFQPASLTVRAKSRKADDDVKPTAGQQLAFKLAMPSRAKVVAWFSTAPGSPPWLKPGPVATWYGGIGRPKPTGKGSFEARVDGPAGTQAVLMPMALTAKYAPSLGRAWDSGADRPAYFLQLRAGGKRQLLLGQLGTCSQTLSTDAGYLLWSGDLDGDGKPDYLVSFNDGGGQEHLYLSGSARSGQIVGLAGQHLAPPVEGECEGEGWKL
ncbi:MAG: hypothetical protein ACXWC4_10835 [Telluria sp.]